MGREVRRVPPNWDHPKIEQHGRVDYQSMYDTNFDEVFQEWLDNFDRIRANGMTDDERKCYPNGLRDWLREDGRFPDSANYRPWQDAEATWFQAWETVSEGTPVTPPFETKVELIDYLVLRGDFWDQKRGRGGWRLDAAERFVDDGYAPSMIVNRVGASITIREPRDGR